MKPHFAQGLVPQPATTRPKCAPNMGPYINNIGYIQTRTLKMGLDYILRKMMAERAFKCANGVDLHFFKFRYLLRWLDNFTKEPYKS